jgi:chromosome partitioning protein
VKTIALIAQKGGVGKTTLAVNLAVASGLRTAIFDLDQQESAAIWTDRRKSDQPHVEFLTERRLSDALKAAERGMFELSIIDTPPAAGPQAYTAAQAADLILIPCRPSLVDLDAIKRTAQLSKRHVCLLLWFSMRLPIARRRSLRTLAPLLRKQA